MSDAQWENLKELFHSALALPPHERSSYLKKCCGDNAALRQAVETLLKSHEETDFVDAPAYQAAAAMLTDGDLKAGQMVGHYRVVSLLGQGGMGEVYLADDTKLNRKVSLKFLTANFTQDDERVRRFEQEARAASALSHPNILTIYEIGEVDGRRFIATEFIEGQTLRERLRSGLDVQDALEIAIQVGLALTAAHRANIVHRDIKPENIMVRRDDGLVKVLDFGLAKVTRTAAGEEKQQEQEVPAQFKTGRGVVMGTVAYMSPEQARGEAVDARTDVWSLGAVLYEMIAGSSPFIAGTSNEIISGILAKAPTPSITRNAPDVTKDLKEVVEKALNKDKEQRYQTSQELVNDLRRLKQSPALTISEPNSQNENPDPTVSREPRSASAVSATTRPSSSAEYLVSQLRAHRRGALASVGIVLILLIAGIGIYAWRIKHSAAATPAPQIKSLAVLPLKSLDSGENYLGVGIADAVIRKTSQTGQLTVRPTSAVLRYVRDDTDSLTAARQLNADAVLEGTWQRSGDRLRVTVNLLRTSDGVSLYSDSFDLTMADVFAIQDKVAQQVAARLRISFDAGQQARNERYPTDPRAYEAYIRGVTSLDERGYEGSMPQMQTTIDFLKRSIEIDPRYTLSHAKLAFAYAWTAVAIDPGNSKWADLAREQLKQAQELNPNLAETHFAHAYLLWTGYEGFQSEAAIRELLLAKQLNPNSSSPDLPAMLGHVGLDDLASRELQRALDIDPTSQSLKELKTVLPYLRGDPDKWFAERQGIPSGFARVDPWYYLRKGLLADAQKAIDERLPKAPQNLDLLMQQALLLALRGDSGEAQSRVPGILSKIQPNNQGRHHSTYDAACIHALAGNSSEAVKWLRETAATGFPNYPLFARDPFLDRIRTSPEFIEFLIEQKARWEKNRQEFGD